MRKDVLDSNQFIVAQGLHKLVKRFPLRVTKTLDWFKVPQGDGCVTCPVVTPLQALTHSCCQETEPRAGWTFWLQPVSLPTEVWPLRMYHSTMLLKIFLIRKKTPSVTLSSLVEVISWRASLLLWKSLTVTLHMFPVFCSSAGRHHINLPTATNEVNPMSWLLVWHSSRYFSLTRPLKRPPKHFTVWKLAALLNIKSFPWNYLCDITYHGLPDPALKHGYQKSPSSAPGEWYQLFWHHMTF